jgi:hypothetical protein
VAEAGRQGSVGVSAAKARCAFYIRTPVDGGFRYEGAAVRSPDNLYLPTEHVPDVGDWVTVPGVAGSHRVVARSWVHAAWGSANWPYGHQEPDTGPLVYLIVEDEPGPFIDEVYEPEGEDAPASLQNCPSP